MRLPIQIRGTTPGSSGIGLASTNPGSSSGIVSDCTATPFGRGSSASLSSSPKNALSRPSCLVKLNPRISAS
jgi:hypothetical protein